MKMLCFVFGLIFVCLMMLFVCKLVLFLLVLVIMLNMCQMVKLCMLLRFVLWINGEFDGVFMFVKVVWVMCVVIVDMIVVCQVGVVVFDYGVYLYD